MKWIGISILLFAVLLTGLGRWVLQKIHCSPKGYSLPIGLAVFLTCVQILYYPAQIFHWSFTYIQVTTFVVLAFAGYCSVKEWKGIFSEYKQPKTLIVLLSLCCFLFVLYRCYLDLEYSDSPMYLNYIAQNINNSHINLFNLYTGVVGEEWDGLYLYQGYYHFCSFYAWLLQKLDSVEVIKAVVWGMGILYSLTSTTLLINIVDSFSVQNKIKKGILLAFALFYLNFYYWKIIFSFYGNTYRSLFITVLMFLLYQKEKGNLTDVQSTVLVNATVFAGLSCSSSYLFVSFAVLSVYAAYRFISKQAGSLAQMSYYIVPMVVYASVLLTRNSKLGIFFGVVFLLYYLFHSQAWIRSLLNTAEGFLIRHARIIFFGILPVAIVLIALWVQFAHPDFLYGYCYFFNNHQDYDMVKDYFFVYSTWYDNIINAVRWVAILFLLMHAKSKEEHYMRIILSLTILIFMNPLCTPTVAYFIASNVFYRAFEAVFNPFTEVFLIVFLNQQLEENEVLSYVPSIALSVTLVVSNVLAFNGVSNAQYGFYISSVPENYDSLSKMEKEAEEVILVLRNELQDSAYTGEQPVLISQAEGTRDYIPNAIQLVTARDQYYASTRIDEELYQIAKRHHPWEEKGTIPYEKTAELLKKYQVDYIIVRYWENSEFDEQLDSCTEILYQTSHFRLRKVIQ